MSKVTLEVDDEQVQTVSTVLVEGQPIEVAKGGRLVVPIEEGDDDVAGQDVDFASQIPKIRRPRPIEWFKFVLASVVTVKLYRKEVGVNGMESEYLHIDRKIRAAVTEHVKPFKVIPYWSEKEGSFGLWVVGFSPGFSWYDSLRRLFEQSPEFYRTKAVRVSSDRENSSYRVRVKECPTEVAWPDRPTEELLGEAIGPDNFIRSADHPEYRDLIAGYDLR